MNKKAIRKKILENPLTREVFFFVGKRKANKRKLDKILAKELKISNKKIDGLVLSLTSYGTRIGELKYTILSLFKQTVLPEIIIVNLAEEDKKYVTDDLRRFEKYGLILNFGQDLRSYKKLLPSLDLYSQKVIVTVDDDIYYASDFLEKLWNEHEKYPKEILCHNAKKITYSQGNINPYTKWIYNPKENKASFETIQIGCGGVLYPVNSLYKDVMNYELIKELAPGADDLWFYFMAILNGTKIKQVENPYTQFRYVDPYREYGITSGGTLTQENVLQGKNDIQFRAIMNHYNIPDEKLIKFYEDKNENCILYC